MQQGHLKRLSGRNDMPLIQCGDHGYAPAVIVCRHLFDGQSRSWCPVDSGDPEVDHDWLCPECLEQYPLLDVEDLRSDCMHCARRLKSRASRRRP
jgi:hypothetical protein